MICVSIAQTSRHLALVDLYNASARCDLIEIRLDRFEKSPDVNELIKAARKPVIVSCRRQQDGGSWHGTEEARLALLRQAVVEGADYVEIEHDCVNHVKRFGPTKRIITFTSCDEIPKDLDEKYHHCLGSDPDVIKLTLPARTPEEAWPFVKIMAKSDVPTVAVGLGKSGRMLNILGPRLGSPWSYAALEKGLEADSGLLSVFDLEEAYDIRNIGRKTPLVAVTGNAEEQLATARILNQAFQIHKSPLRCLPLEVGSIPLFAKIAKSIRLAGLIVDAKHREEILEIVTKWSRSCRLAESADVIAIREGEWHGFHTLSRAVTACLAEGIDRSNEGTKSVSGRSVLVIGGSGTARAIAATLLDHDARLVMADDDNERAEKIVHELGGHGRYVARNQVFSTLSDGMVICSHDENPGQPAIDIPITMARPGLACVDLTSFPQPSGFLKELARFKGAPIEPLEVFLHQMQYIAKLFTGHLPPIDKLRQSLVDFDIESDPRGDEAEDEYQSIFL
ncbi:3-dehydroquinate dehydratase [Planctomycetes bacterium Pan216]|uniref:3-dehydroquinate dehydratase n=1 Tax=Kolteria novifilia TaxID=2527975 RepID=A0A518BCU9_9BACT|nr:3-dehydroquinate dehydratase [Planctomycetes bacterium Pan216]